MPDDEKSIRLALDAALGRAERRHQVKARCQSIRRKPPGTARTRPTYSIKVCYQFPLDRYFNNFAERATFSEIIEVEISLNDLVCETRQGQLRLDSHPIIACSLEDILGEKLHALLQQIPRNRSRPQDVYDIAAMRRKYRDSLNYVKMSDFLIRKSQIREIIATRAAYDGQVMAQATINYEDQLRRTTDGFIPFEDAWSEVLDVVSQLEIPER